MKSSGILIIFGVVCLFFSMIFSGGGANKQTQTLPGHGGLFGPVVVKDKNATYEITIKNRVALKKWSNISVDILDEKQQYLFNFGDGM